MSNLARRIEAAGFVRPDDPDHLDALMFLMAEAELLDAGDLVGWLTLLASEVDYRAPVQTTRLRADARPGRSGGYHLHEDRASLEFRVKRIVESDSAWSANPASRTRRFISNVRTRRGDDELRVSSYLLLLRSRHDIESYDLLSAERNDVLTRTPEGDLELRAREIVIDQSRLGISPLPFPL